MGELFLVEDLINTLIAIEDYGNRTYKELADKVNNEEVKSLFIDLAKHEEKHKEHYEKLKKRFNTSKEVSEEYQNYLRILLRHSIFKTLDSDIGDDIEDALQLAISLEKETLIFLSEVQTILGSSSYAVFEDIKNEERSHLASILSVVESRKGKQS